MTTKNKIYPFFERILAIGAHPDDIELGCFGTLARYHAEGSTIGFVVLSFGGVGGELSLRKKEAAKSAMLLSAKTYYGGLTDTKISDGWETINVIEKAIKDFEPTSVIINFPDDTHQDHRNAARATISASRLVPTILLYQTPSSTRDFNPKLFVEITNFIDLKIQAINIHRTQGKNVYMADRAVKGLAEFLGFQIYQGNKLYEGFDVYQVTI